MLYGIIIIGRHDLNVEMTILYESNNDLTRLLEKYKED